MKKFALLAIVLSLFTACNTSIGRAGGTAIQAYPGDTFAVTCSSGFSTTVPDGGSIVLTADQLGLIHSQDKARVKITLLGSVPKTFTISGASYSIVPSDRKCTSTGCTLYNSSDEAMYTITCSSFCNNLGGLTISAKSNPMGLPDMK